MFRNQPTLKIIVTIAVLGAIAYVTARIVTADGPCTPRQAEVDP